MREHFPDPSYVNSAAEALRGADGAVILTDWGEFAPLDEEFEAMETELVIDCRRVVEPPSG